MKHLLARFFGPRRIYLDHAAATPLVPEAVLAIRAAERLFGNPSAIHSEGVAASVALSGARAKLARLTGVRETGIVFTASGTEANNLAIIGTLEARRQAGLAYEEMEVVTTAVEHPSVTNTVAYLERLGVRIHRVPVDARGQVVIEALEQALSTKTVLVTLSYVNSEVGTTADTSKVARAITNLERKTGKRPVFHLDAAQAPLWLSCQLPPLKADIITFDAAKCGGPKGVGILAHRHGVTLAPTLFGGPQERGLRPGTENVAGVFGAVAAFEAAEAGRAERVARVTELREFFIKELLAIPGVVLNGTRDARVANNVNISVPGIDTEFAVVSLDAAGIAASTKSACSGAGGGESAVVLAMTGDTARAKATIRFTLGPQTTKPELVRTVAILRTHLEKMRAFTDSLQPA